MGGSGATSPLSRRTSPPSHHPGHLLVPRGELQAADLQQDICVPVVGGRHRLGPGPLLHALHPLHRPLQAPALQRLLARGEGDAARDLLPPSRAHLSHPHPCPLLSPIPIQVPALPTLLSQSYLQPNPVPVPIPSALTPSQILSLSLSPSHSHLIPLPMQFPSLSQPYFSPFTILVLPHPPSKSHPCPHHCLTPASPKSLPC